MYLKYLLNIDIVREQPRSGRRASLEQGTDGKFKLTLLITRSLVYDVAHSNLSGPSVKHQNPIPRSAAVRSSSRVRSRRMLSDIIKEHTLEPGSRTMEGVFEVENQLLAPPKRFISASMGPADPYRKPRRVEGPPTMKRSPVGQAFR